jgi:enoyl-CoA hydratase/carnithine racemase
MGFVNEVLPDAQVLERALAQARKLAALSPSAVVTAKALMKRGQRAQIEQQLREEAVQFGRLVATPEAREAMAAFFTRKKPDPGS